MSAPSQRVFFNKNGAHVDERILSLEGSKSIHRTSVNCRIYYTHSLKKREREKHKQRNNRATLINAASKEAKTPSRKEARNMHTCKRVNIIMLFRPPIVILGLR